MSNNFKELKNRLKKAQEEAANGGGNKLRKNNNIYPFWNMNLNESARMRLIPDANEENPNLFYVEYKEHTLSISGKDRKIPCLQNYGEKCPICELSAAHYKAEGKESVKGKYFWRDLITYLRALIIEDPLPPDEETKEKAVGKVKVQRFSFSLMKRLNEQIANDLGDDDNPFDLDKGFDFIVKSMPQAGSKHVNWLIGSGFARNSTSVPEEYRKNIELVDLKTLIPANPGLEKVQRMLEAHLSGEDYNDGKPTGESNESGSDANESNEDTQSNSEDTSTVSTSTPVAQEDEDLILTQLLARRKAAAAAKASE